MLCDQSHRVLIVDDDKDTSDFIVEYIKSMTRNTEIDVAYDGDDGWRKMDSWVPTVALLDICIPFRSGIDLAKSARTDNRFENTILVAASGRCETKTVLDAANVGFDFFLSKPFENMASLVLPLHLGRQTDIVLLGRELVERSREIIAVGARASERSRIALAKSRALLSRMDNPWT